MNQQNVIITNFLELLRSIDNIINETIRTLVTDFTVSTFFMLISFSFLYGILHSIGPGHGKSLVASFFLKEKHPLKKAITLSAIVSVIHTGSAVLLSLLLYFVLTGVKGMFKIKIQSYFMAISGILITIVGISFLLYKIINKNKEKNIDSSKSKNIFLIGISAGIVPCPVALMIMLLTLSKKIMLIGLLSVTSISLGMFVLLTVVGLVSIKSRDGLLFASGKISKKTEFITTIIEYVSIVIIIIIGLSMSIKTFLWIF